MTFDAIYAQLRQLAEQYQLFQCQTCADDLQHWLKMHHILGVYIKIVARNGDFIISERVGSDISITQNGCHYGIEVAGKVFDNLPNSGLTKQEWLSDFECVGGFEIEESSF